MTTENININNNNGGIKRASIGSTSSFLNEFRSALQHKDSVRNFQALLQQSGSQQQQQQMHDNQHANGNTNNTNSAIRPLSLSKCFSQSHRNAVDVIYELFKIPNKSEASIGKLLTVLKSYGLHPRNDPRLRPMMDRIFALEKESEEQDKEAKDPKHWKLSCPDYCKCIAECVPLIERTLQNNLIVPSWGYFCDIIRDIYNQCLEVHSGRVATYIPQLARVDPSRWGVAICTIDGQRVAMGDTKEPFCLQSVSKAFNYAIAASELGADQVHQFVGQEPSGRLFNEICLDSKNRPHNPMVNSGAIIVTSLIQKQLNLADRFDYILQEYRKIAGGQYVGFNNAVFLSERATSDRNWALAYYMKEYKCFPPESGSLQETLDFYFQLCALEANCESAAVMAATLANGGVCPLTEERCIQSRPCRDVLSLMYSCGMYDYSGQFAFHVGLPAKSGISGAMVVVVPNLMGICLWSPALDEMGNSCRGVHFCKEMINRFNFHNYDSLAHTELSKFDPRKRVGEQERDQIVSLLFAAKSGDLNTVRRIWMQGGNLEIRDYDQRTALHLAACEGHIELMKFLLNVAHVQQLETRDRWNRTPRDDAQTFEHWEVVQLLEKAAKKMAASAAAARNDDAQMVAAMDGGDNNSRSKQCCRNSSISSEEDGEEKVADNNNTQQPEEVFAVAANAKGEQSRGSCCCPSHPTMSSKMPMDDDENNGGGGAQRHSSSSSSEGSSAAGLQFRMVMPTEQQQSGEISERRTTIREEEMDYFGQKDTGGGGGEGGEGGRRQ